MNIYSKFSPEQQADITPRHAGLLQFAEQSVPMIPNLLELCKGLMNSLEHDDAKRSLLESRELVTKLEPILGEYNTGPALIALAELISVALNAMNIVIAPVSSLVADQQMLQQMKNDVGNKLFEQAAAKEREDSAKATASN